MASILTTFNKCRISLLPIKIKNLNCPKWPPNPLKTFLLLDSKLCAPSPYLPSGAPLFGKSIKEQQKTLLLVLWPNTIISNRSNVAIRGRKPLFSAIYYPASETGTATLPSNQSKIPKMLVSGNSVLEDNNFLLVGVLTTLAPSWPSILFRPWLWRLMYAGTGAREGLFSACLKWCTEASTLDNSLWPRHNGPHSIKAASRLGGEKGGE